MTGMNATRRFGRSKRTKRASAIARFASRSERSDLMDASAAAYLTLLPPPFDSSGAGGSGWGELGGLGGGVGATNAAAVPFSAPLHTRRWALCGLKEAAPTKNSTSAKRPPPQTRITVRVDRERRAVDAEAASTGAPPLRSAGRLIFTRTITNGAAKKTWKL
jgi:hypothetical protein